MHYPKELISYINLHRLGNGDTPNMFKRSLLMYITFNSPAPHDELIQLNHNQIYTSGQNHFITNHNYTHVVVIQNAFDNTFHELNCRIELEIFN
jgi:hypothetical protein